MQRCGSLDQVSPVILDIWALGSQLVALCGDMGVSSLFEKVSLEADVRV